MSSTPVKSDNPSVLSQLPDFPKGPIQQAGRKKRLAAKIQLDPTVAEDVGRLKDRLKQGFGLAFALPTNPLGELRPGSHS